MSGAWERTHRRYQLVHTVLDEVARTGRSVVPVALRADVDAEFGDFGGFLREVQRRWQRSFDARLDGLLESPSEDRGEAARTVWRELAADLPETRLMLDTHAAHPALAESAERHRETYAVEESRPAPSACPVTRWWRSASA